MKAHALAVTVRSYYCPSKISVERWGRRLLDYNACFCFYCIDEEGMLEMLAMQGRAGLNLVRLAAPGQEHFPPLEH